MVSPDEHDEKPKMKMFDAKTWLDRPRLSWRQRLNPEHWERPLTTTEDALAWVSATQKADGLRELLWSYYEDTHGPDVREAQREGIQVNVIAQRFSMRHLEASLALAQAKFQWWQRHDQKAKKAGLLVRSRSVQLTGAHLDLAADSYVCLRSFGEVDPPAVMGWDRASLRDHWKMRDKSIASSLRMKLDGLSDNRPSYSSAGYATLSTVSLFDPSWPSVTGGAELGWHWWTLPVTRCRPPLYLPFAQMLSATPILAHLRQHAPEDWGQQIGKAWWETRVAEEPPAMFGTLLDDVSRQFYAQAKKAGLVWLGERHEALGQRLRDETTHRLLSAWQESSDVADTKTKRHRF